MSISNHEEKAAHKILCVGGSTLNTGTIEKIKYALVEINFLQEWALIFVNHLYFKIEQKQKYKNKIQQEWQGININFIDQIGDHPIQINTVYILPDTSNVPGELDFLPKEDESNLSIRASKDWRYADCIEKNSQVILQVLDPQSSHDKYYDWSEKNSYDAGHNLRNYMPCIDKFMEELADVKTKIKDLTIAGLILCGCDGDGAYGLKAIKNEGGETAVQNSNECRNPKKSATWSMPSIAIKKEQNHEKISIEGNSDFTSLTDWLKSIR